MLQEAARARSTSGIAIDTSAVSGGPGTREPRRLRRLVRNLLDNCVKHARTTVQVALSGDDTVSRLDVRDDGPGIPAEDFDRVFDRFYRADGSRSRGTGGTGLGLAIARTIAQRHGGT